jgi:tight adherence protein B
MPNVDMTFILLIGLAALAVGLLAYVAVSPLVTGEHRAEKRLDALAKSKANRVGTRQEKADDRRKQVTDTLKYADQKRAAGKKVTLKSKLIQAGLAASPEQFHMASGIMGAIGFVISLVGGLSFVTAALVGFASGMGLPRWILRFLAKRRQAKFTNEFANAIDVIVRGVKTGLPLGECRAIIARESPEPVKGEFVDLVEGQKLGIPLQECFDRMQESMPLNDVNFFSIVIAIQQTSGGNLAEALGNLSGVLRSRKMLAAKVAALSGEAKASAAILGGLPFVVMIMVYMTSPAYIMLLFTEKLGHIILAVAAFWMTCGVVVMRQMVNFKY